MKIFCDFDGTVAENDVGNLFFRTFGGQRCLEVVARWKAGEISSKTCLTLECDATRVSREQMARFADQQKLDPFFGDFVAFCREQRVEVTIVSDGLDFYIERILRNHGLAGEVEFRSNRVVFLDGNRIRPEFPYYELGCRRCGNCKGWHVREAKAQGHRVVYIGDGLSDRCGAEAADVVFAKRGRDLLRYCRRNGIPCHEFNDFGEVQRKLTELIPLPAG
ncbi:MAG: 2-hydroxy-3-keto-5-methylthiopentenyl-1-phosphate phosphatase [Calditrichaeota bacterium]|nr:MAG: 2-hydroxy-3-keto-5-methylthiopentenyl-1-phosphate phosphatase [Calditrichota bacterium]